MKKILIFRTTIIITVIAFLVNCRSNSIEETPQVAKTCKILKSVAEFQNPDNPYKEVQTINYQYDIKGNLIKKSLIIDRTTKSEIQNIQILTYNNDGFLIEKSFNATNAAPNVAVSKSSGFEKYTYTNDRLATTEISYTNKKGVTSVENIKYIYDSGGILTSRESRKQDGTIATFTYDNKGLLTDYVVKSSTGTTQPYTIQNGLVTMIIEKYGCFSCFRYNENRQNIRTITHTDWKLNSVIENEYNNALRAEISLPKLKGFPTIKNEMGEDGVLNKFRYFFLNTAGDGKVHQRNESTYVNHKNWSGFVTKVDLTNAVLADSILTSGATLPGNITKSTQIFTYTDCN